MEQCGENLGSPFVLWVKNVKLLEKVDLILMEYFLKKEGAKEFVLVGVVSKGGFDKERDGEGMRKGCGMA